MQPVCLRAIRLTALYPSARPNAALTLRHRSSGRETSAVLIRK